MTQAAVNIASYTVDQVTVMALPALKELGTSLGLESISRTPKAVLQQMVLDKIEELQGESQQVAESVEIEENITPNDSELTDAGQHTIEPVGASAEKPERAKRRVDVYINEEHRQILNNDNLAKSEKMRRLWKKGMSIADIHRVLDTHYSFTYGVIDRYRKIVGE